jgi:hypothetical protein
VVNNLGDWIEISHNYDISNKNILDSSLIKLVLCLNYVVLKDKSHKIRMVTFCLFTDPVAHASEVLIENTCT